MALKDSLTKVRLPNEMKLHENRCGIKREDQQHFNVLSKSARYVETSMKILLNINSPQEITQEKLEQLALVNIAQINYLQDEYSTLVVQGTCNPQVGKMFRAFRKNTSGLSGSAIDDLVGGCSNEFSTTTKPRVPTTWWLWWQRRLPWLLGILRWLSRWLQRGLPWWLQ